MPAHATLFLLVAIFVALAPTLVAARDAELEQALLTMSKTFNKTLPLQIDKEKMLEATATFQDTIIFKYKFTDETVIKNPRFSRSKYEKHLRMSLHSSTCDDPNVRELMRRGANFNYLFTDRSGMKIADFTLNAAECSRR